jgi:hypothetical protein
VPLFADHLAVDSWIWRLYTPHQNGDLGRGLSATGMTSRAPSKSAELFLALEFQHCPKTISFCSAACVALALPRCYLIPVLNGAIVSVDGSPTQAYFEMVSLFRDGAAETHGQGPTTHRCYRWRRGGWCARSLERCHCPVSSALGPVQECPLDGYLLFISQPGFPVPMAGHDGHDGRNADGDGRHRLPGLRYHRFTSCSVR